MKRIFITIPWFHPAYKAGSPIQSIANMAGQMGNGNFEFKIICSNKDLDGSLLQAVAFNEWVNYNVHTKIWYSSTDNILRVLELEIKTKATL